MSENKASEMIADKYADGAESVARHLRSRLKKLRQERQAAPALVAIPPAGSLGLLKFLVERAQEYRLESIGRGAWDDPGTDRAHGSHPGPGTWATV